MVRHSSGRVHGGFGVLLLIAACGGGTGMAPPPQSPPPSSSAPSAPASAPFEAPAPSPTASQLPPNPVPAPSASAAVPIQMKPPVPTAMSDELKARGLDPGKLPPMAKLPPKTLRGVMKLFTRSLGVPCLSCHSEGDFAASTPQKKIAAKMWDQFVSRLGMQDGAPLFCDSCHEGRATLLDRSDKKALSAWMDENFVSKLTRNDGKDHGCETCHVDMEMHLLALWSK